MNKWEQLKNHIKDMDDRGYEKVYIEDLLIYMDELEQLDNNDLIERIEFDD